jgi:hypothetical protein
MVWVAPAAAGTAGEGARARWSVRVRRARDRVDWGGGMRMRGVGEGLCRTAYPCALSSRGVQTVPQRGVVSSFIPGIGCSEGRVGTISRTVYY